MEQLRHLEFFASDDPTPSGPSGGLPGPSSTAAVLALGVGILLLVAATGQVDSFAKQMAVHFNRLTAPAEPASKDTTEEATPYAETLRDRASHPDVMHATYLSGGPFARHSLDAELHREFQDLLDLYQKRQGVDGNFDVRVTNKATGELLEVYTLRDMKSAYEQGREYDWGHVDTYRRRATRRLVDKYVDRGIPKEDIRVRWGRAHQVREAHERDQPFVEYEIRLAEYLGLSLLPTEIGTVETFNQDWMVSGAGARSRYQMMPWILRRSGVNTYSLRTEAGSWVEVEEEQHPLLTMEPAFRLLRGYVNAVGHEIPGISAYHTGPGNIYTVYRTFLKKSKHFHSTSSVVDAFMWALTEGFEQVDAVSTFGPYSRGYVPSAYGALRANDGHPIDTTQTLRAVRVQLRPGERLPLTDLFAALDASGKTFDWGMREETGRDSRSTYARFVDLNPHFDLPDPQDGEMPATANVRLVSSVDGKAVRFFLPLTAPKVLRDAGMDVIDPAQTFRYDGSTYAPPADSQVTKWDREYDRLIAETKHFAFTPENRERLLALHDKFQVLAEESPTHYRRLQLDVIQTHKRIWTAEVWNKLSRVAMDATGRARMRIQPPVELDTPLLPGQKRPTDDLLPTASNN